MISLSTKLLHDAIAKARAVAPATSSLEILKNVKIEARSENAWIVLTATNLDAQIALDVEADIDAPLSCCVDPTRLLTAIGAGGETTKITLDGERLKIATGKSVFKLPKLPAEDFPIFTDQGPTLAAFECSWIGPTIKRLLPFCGDEREIRPHCKSVSLRAKEGKIEVSATSGFAAALTVINSEEKRDFTILLPLRISQVLAGIEVTRAVVKHNGILFMGENMQIVSKLMEGTMPSFDTIFTAAPAEGDLTVKRAEAMRAVKSCAQVTESALKVRPVRLAADEGGIYVEGVSPKGGEGKIALDGVGSGINMGLQDSILLALLDCVDGEDVTLTRKGQLIFVEGDNFKASGASFRI